LDRRLGSGQSKSQCRRPAVAFQAFPSEILCPFGQLLGLSKNLGWIERIRLYGGGQAVDSSTLGSEQSGGGPIPRRVVVDDRHYRRLNNRSGYDRFHRLHMMMPEPATTAKNAATGAGIRRTGEEQRQCQTDKDFFLEEG
jgi:hypothetical protein